MDCLVRVSFVSLRSLAGTQECKERLVKVEFHEFRHGEHSILHDETALEWVGRILIAVTCKVQDRGIREPLQDSASGWHCSRLNPADMHIADEIDRRLRRYGTPQAFDLLGHEG